MFLLSSECSNCNFHMLDISIKCDDKHMFQRYGIYDKVISFDGEFCIICLIGKQFSKLNSLQTKWCINENSKLGVNIWVNAFFKLFYVFV